MADSRVASNEMRALILLHELGHELNISAFTQADFDMNANLGNTMEVIGACFQ